MSTAVAGRIDFRRRCQKTGSKDRCPKTDQAAVWERQKAWQLFAWRGTGVVISKWPVNSVLLCRIHRGVSPPMHLWRPSSTQGHRSTCGLPGKFDKIDCTVVLTRREVGNIVIQQQSHEAKPWMKPILMSIAFNRFSWLPCYIDNKSTARKWCGFVVRWW